MDFRLPQLGEGIDSATVVNVLVKPGDRVRAGSRWSRSRPTRRRWTSRPTPTGRSRRCWSTPGQVPGRGPRFLRLQGVRRAAG
jgi:hypothetical protein